MYSQPGFLKNIFKKYKLRKGRKSIFHSVFLFVCMTSQFVGYDLFSLAATTDRKHIWSSFRDPLWLNNGIRSTIKPSGSSSSHLQESLSVTTVTILSKLCKSEVELDFQSFQLIRFRTEGNVLVSNQVLIVVDRMMRMRMWIILLQYFFYIPSISNNFEK